MAYGSAKSFVNTPIPYKTEVRKCARTDCERPAYPGWTNCSRHYSAGTSLENAQRLVAKMTSTIENEILEALITAYEEKLNRLRNRRLGSAKQIVIQNMEAVLAAAKNALPPTDH